MSPKVTDYVTEFARNETETRSTLIIIFHYFHDQQQTRGRGQPLTDHRSSSHLAGQISTAATTTTTLALPDSLAPEWNCCWNFGRGKLDRRRTDCQDRRRRRNPLRIWRRGFERERGPPNMKTCNTGEMNQGLIVILIPSFLQILYHQYAALPWWRFDLNPNLPG